MNDAPVTFTVLGTPKTQGSMRHIGNGRMLHKPDLIDWRTDVAIAANRAMTSRLPLEGAVVVELDFALPRPKSLPRKVLHPVSRRFDIDKGARAILDALVIGGVLGDDSQVIDLRARKSFAGSAAALALPGVHVAIEVVA